MVQEDRCVNAIAQYGRSPIFTDSVNTEIILHQEITRKSTSGLYVRYFFIRDAVADNLISPHRISTKENAAGGFTEALRMEELPGFLNLLGMDDS
ncbi:uncharacterized protein N7506_004746 [Penicillium brevicompactum]|uniref:uncharacterized protein n=1 Tax=Penicillium brevicompactum TaxID=5074 RepID=UPI0025423C9F|nr:uncharacterized protein N7506_004746 [Penicillium brevicompactum]KAJ5336724.1 hypothetical protein N7506_004746 [Penicillium brevicompactum]